MNQYQKALLIKFLEGRCDIQEQNEVRLLLNLPAAKEFLREELAIRAIQEENTAIPDDPALAKTVKRIKYSVYARMRHTSKYHRIVAYAAVWAVAVAIGSIFLLYIRNHHKPTDNNRIVKQNVKGIPVRYHLPDSSIVFLAAGSTLSYAENYPDDGRELTLNGEAFFDVAPNHEKPFIIHSGAVKTIVLGTSFKVFSFPDKSIEIAVATGKVAVSREMEKKGGELAILSKGMKVNYDPVSGQTRVGAVDTFSLTQWKSGELVFTELALPQLLDEVQRRYNVRFTIQGKQLENHHLSGSIAPNQRLEQVLGMLSKLGKFRYHETNTSHFFITPNP